MKLVYTGPVKELGFKLESGSRIVAHPDEPFEVGETDGAALLNKYSKVLEAVKPTRASRQPDIKQAEEPNGEIDD